MAEQAECRFQGLLNLPRAGAFRLFVDTPELWWVSSFQEAGDRCMDVGIEPCSGGACYEVRSKGQRNVWGTVLSKEEPLFLRLAWQVSQDGSPVADPATASRVMVNFRYAGETTRLEVVHSEFLRHGEEGTAYLNDMAESQGWPQTIQRLQDAAARLR